VLKKSNVTVHHFGISGLQPEGATPDSVGRPVSVIDCCRAVLSVVRTPTLGHPAGRRLWILNCPWIYPWDAMGTDKWALALYLIGASTPATPDKYSSPRKKLGVGNRFFRTTPKRVELLGENDIV